MDQGLMQILALLETASDDTFAASGLLEGRPFHSSGSGIRFSVHSEEVEAQRNVASVDNK
jgi:hypothetical protein